MKGKLKENNYILSDKVYRDINALNQSMVKMFDENPVEFFLQCKMGKKRKDKKSTALIIGDIVDFYILECKGNIDIFNSRFDEKFSLYEDSGSSGQAFYLADVVYEICDLSTDENGVQTRSFDDIFQEACQRVQVDGKYKNKSVDKILEDFTEKALSYYEKKLENIGKTVVQSSLLDKALIVSDNIIHDSFVTQYLDERKRTSYEDYLTHFVIEWVYQTDEGESINCKSEIDAIIIDNKNKTIQLIDLKTTYDNESFEYNYIKNKYYIQNAFYTKAVNYWKDMNGMQEYTLLPIKFIVGDTSASKRRPIVYNTSKEDYENGLNGFSLKGQKYKGIKEIIEEIIWAEKSNVWNCSKNVYENNGLVNLNVNYEKI